MPAHNRFSQPSTADKPVTVRLDGLLLELPAGRRSLNSIRCHLETIALGRRRLLSALSVDGHPVNLLLPLPHHFEFSQIEAESVELEENTLVILKTALQQTSHAHEGAEILLTLVLINSPKAARELWWNFARQLKEPVLTLSLLPENLCGTTEGMASLKQLRKWQLEQLAVIIREVDHAGFKNDTIQLSNAIESRVLPWLEKLGELIQLWHETEFASARLGRKPETV